MVPGKEHSDALISMNNMATTRPSLLGVCVDVQTVILKFIIQPYDLPNSSLHKDFPPSESIIPYAVPLQSTEHFRREYTPRQSLL
jgi:hypothetical protein